MAELIVTQDVEAPTEQVWAALVDWELHGEWMLFTHASGGAAVGEPIEAFTGIGRFGFLDRMTITVWEPPHRLVIAWQITHEWGYEPDLAKSSEVEIRFTAQPTFKAQLSFRRKSAWPRPGILS